ncbi:hypothetical protein CRG98_012148 [Punica granatum]|uniref:Uncharacterized protein n=1 Tax=Punica granatum TaxID=22663 RepID=A0A2I0KGD5_PUNGR|nr:hypothetical protein CRG98_012148 [Punica granatum]
MLGCKGCTFGCARTSGAQAGTQGHARAPKARSWQARGRLAMRAGERLCTRAHGCARVPAGARESAATGALFTREHDLHPK